VIPVVGLALTSAPDFAHYFPFLDTLSNKSPIAVGIVTVLVPALAATLFIAIALVIVNCKVPSIFLKHEIDGDTSQMPNVSAAQSRYPSRN
jgi:hypothetical protein